MPANSDSEWMPAEVVEVGKWQKYLIWLILFQVISIILFFAVAVGSKGSAASRTATGAMGVFLFVARIVLTVFSIYCVYQNAKCLKKSAPVIYSLGMFLPFINLLVLAHLSAEATRVLRENGIHVGVMGADQADMERLSA